MILHKILPKLSFDGGRKVSTDRDKLEVLKEMRNAVKDLLNDLPPDISRVRSYSATNALQVMIDRAESNDKIVSYWS